jgi:hypothetical protein
MWNSHLFLCETQDEGNNEIDALVHRPQKKNDVQRLVVWLRNASLSQLLWEIWTQMKVMWICQLQITHVVSAAETGMTIVMWICQLQITHVIPAVVMTVPVQGEVATMMTMMMMTVMEMGTTVYLLHGY